MNWNKWIRQFHRWVSIVFTVAVIVNIVVTILGLEEYGVLVGILALIPLILLLLTGLYLFALPYTAKQRRAKRAADTQ
jgi:hypothetical protein